MEPLTSPGALRPAGVETGAGGRLDAFRATDAFALAAVRVSSELARSDQTELAREILRLVLRGGGALVAASCAEAGSAGERVLLESARDRLSESRYALYLARRLGALDLRRYRALASQQDAALRELAALLIRASGVRRPP
ncbi:MAG: hypothetical protein LAO51_17480 [Acidobacteriia bacterium]|nr:hypothetical protein [Terriglobia bacterium]